MYHFAFNKIPVELSSQLYILVSQTLSPVSLGQPLNRSGQFQLSKWLPFTACHKSIATETDTERAGPRALGQGDRVEIIALCNIGFPDSSAGKESACNAGDPDSVPGSGRSAGEGIDYPLQSSWASLVKNLPGMRETWV